MSIPLQWKSRQGALLAAALLRYPRRSFAEIMLETGVEPQRLAAMHEGFTTFLEATLSLPPETVRDEYVRLFDFTPQVSLNLAWHVYGDSPDLGRAYAGLQELYRDAGLESLTDELPDYLPKVLECLGLAPDWTKDVLLDGFGGVLPLLETRLRERDSLYTPLLTAVVDLFDARLLQLPNPRQPFRASPAGRHNSTFVGGTL